MAWWVRFALPTTASGSPIASSQLRNCVRKKPPDGTDLRAIYDGRISITPLHIDMTHHAYRDELAKMLKVGDA